MGQLQEVQHFHHRGPEGEEKEQEIRNLFEKINEIKLPSFGEGNRHASPGSTESPKQDGC